MPAATGRPFSVAAGIAHLRGLGPADLAEAHRYVRRAPCGTRTPLRRALAGDPWWRSIARPGGGRYSAGRVTCSGWQGVRPETP
jgi:hypothetical protein